MDETPEDYKLKIEKELYTQIMLLIENQYNLEGIIDITKKNSTKIVFKDKKEAIRSVAEEINRFANENNLDIKWVKNHLLKTIRNKIELNNDFKDEYQEAQNIIISKDYEEK